jgi:DNA-binding NarL/FixJ family response regulator
MDLWGAIGTLWDQAYDAEPGLAASQATHLADLAGTDAERAILLGVRSLCEVLLCRYADATRTALDAAILAERATGPLADDARLYTASARLLASAMIEPALSGVTPTLPLARLEDVQAWVSGLDRRRPERLLLALPAVEATMSSGQFAVADALVSGLRPFLPSDSHYSSIVRVNLDTLYARSLAFRGELAALATKCTEIVEDPHVVKHPQSRMLAEALLCYCAGQRSDRKEVERLSASVLAEARGRANYISVGSSLLVTWAFAAIGQVQRAAALLVGASGGEDLPRIKTWDRAAGYELLATAALRRGDLAGAKVWAERATPLGVIPVASAAVERTLSRVAAAMGDPVDAATRAYASASLDAVSGARLERLRDRILYATALAAAGDHELAVQTLAEIASEADLLGATAVRKLASQVRRQLSEQLPSGDGGFASLSDREREIAILVAEGHTNRSIGSTLFLSERTVQTHLSRILKVMGLPSRTAIPAALGLGTHARETPVLTSRQEQIAELVARGFPNATIASELGISVKTVENHLAGIFLRWQVSSRTAVANLYVARSRQLD